MRFLIGLILLPLLLVRAQPEPQTFFIGGQERQYYLYLPDGISDDAPLVFVLHGYSGDALGIMNYSGMNQVADDNGFAVCYPQGLSDDWDYNFWNVGYDWHEYETVDDVEFLTLPNLYCTPHTGGSAEESILAMGRSAIRHLVDYFRG